MYEPPSCELSKMQTGLPAPLCQLLYYTTVLLKYCIVKLKMFIFCICFLYVLFV